MFGCTKPTGEITAVARTPPCRYHLGLGIYNVQVAVEGMDGNKKNHLLHLCGQLLRLVLIPFHNTWRNCAYSTKCQTVAPAAPRQETWAQKCTTIFHSSTLANAMTTLLSNSSNSQLVALANTLDKGEHSLGQMWTEDLQAEHKQDLSDCQQLLPGATGVFRAATPQERARRPLLVDPELLDGTAIGFRRSLVRLAYILHFFWTAPSPFRLVTNFEAYLRTSGESNHHRKSVRVVERHRPTNFTTGTPD